MTPAHAADAVTPAHAVDAVTPAHAVDAVTTAHAVDAATPLQGDGEALAQLRLATRALHAQLDSQLGLMDEALDLPAYTAILARLHGFWRGWLPHAAGLLSEEALSGPRRRARLLTADLRALGLDPAHIERLAVCPPPALGSAAEALGSLYVVEGSALGAKQIQRHVAGRLGLGATSGCAYFNGYGAQTGAMWRGLLCRLDTVSGCDVAAVQGGAVATFARLIVWMAR